MILHAAFHQLEILLQCSEMVLLQGIGTFQFTPWPKMYYVILWSYLY
jgi:hypothetical protein